MTANWEQAAAKKQAARDALIPADARLKSPPGADVLDVSDVPRSCGLLSDEELAITEAPSVEGLLKDIASRKYSSEKVVRAFCKRAAIAQQLTNCLTEIFFDRAIAHAKELDAEYARTGKLRGPLHGLPISLKEQVGVKDVECSFGFVGFIGRMVKRHSSLAQILVDQGAVPYCMTNIAQHLGFGEAVNNVFGETTNPYNRKLTSGGSSGGEGALVALRGSILGVGSDIAGSIRIPSGFSGVYGLRPSYSRVPYEGTVNSQEGQESLRSVLGPLSGSIDGLRVFFKAVVDGEPWHLDPVALRMAWNQERYDLKEHGGGGKLVFGLLVDDKNVRPHPPYKRALEAVRKAVIASGHEVIDYEPYNAAEGWGLLGETWLADGHKDLYDTLALGGEPRAGPEKHLKQTKEVTITEYWKIQFRKQKFLKAQHDHWRATADKTGTGRPIDALLAPVSATCPQLLQEEQYLGYTGMCNLADLPAAVIPVTRVDPAQDPKVPRSDYYNATDKKLWEMYDPQVYNRAPIGIQIIGQKNEEEAVLRMAEIVDAAVEAARK